MAEDEVGIRIVVLGGSAGSLDVVLKIIRALPADTGAAFMVVLHRKNDHDSLLAGLVEYRTTMRVKEVEDKEPIRPNTVYIAPADYHLLVENQQYFSLDASEKVHYSRPSINVTFESVAEIFGPQVIGVLLSGANEDGADGLLKIKEAGGLTVVQDPATAEVDFMPRQAIKNEAATYIIPAAELPVFLVLKLLRR